jgi:hypothetical protein
MSNYFQVLKKIEQDRSGRTAATSTAAPVAPVAPVPPVSAETTPVSAVPPPITPVPSLATRPLRMLPTIAPSSTAAPRPTLHTEIAPPARPAVQPLSDEGRRGIATLFDNIRALASGSATRTLVFAGAAASDSVHSVSEGLAQHAQRHGMSAFIAELIASENGPLLVPRTQAPGHDSPGALGIDLNSGVAPGELNAWVERCAGNSDLVILEAPPLADSIDAALLACACDGLVIVADAEVTSRTALQLAAERSQIAGCRTLGVVMNGTKEHMPNWMRRLFGASEHGRTGGA